MIETIFYDSSLSSGYIVLSDIQTNVHELRSLITELDRYNYNLISFNSEGILIKSKELVDIEYRVSSLESDRGYMKNDIIGLTDINTVLADNINKLYDSIKVLQNEENKSVSNVEGMYILWDLLPENLRKAIKVYIKKTK